jgi:hypothetical protein
VRERYQLSDISDQEAGQSLKIRINTEGTEDAEFTEKSGEEV